MLRADVSIATYDKVAIISRVCPSIGCFYSSFFSGDVSLVFLLKACRYCYDNLGNLFEKKKLQEGGIGYRK